MSGPFRFQQEEARSPLDRTASPPAFLSTGQPVSYKTNVNRAKTKKWVTAKKNAYDGDDWGEYDEYDDYGTSQPEEPPSQPPLPNQRYYANDAGHQARNFTEPGRQPPVAARRNSFEAGEEHRAFSASIAPPQSSDNQGQQQLTSPQALPPLQTRISPNPSDVNNSTQFAPRRSSIGQQDSPVVASPRGRAGSQSDKPLPFIRPADIYKRVEEERERERASLDSLRPSLDSLGARPKDDVAASAPHTEGTRQLQPLETVAERKSEYLPDFEPATAHKGRQATEANAAAPAPQNLPLEGVPAFSSDFWSSGPQLHQPTSFTPIVSPPDDQNLRSVVDQAFTRNDDPRSVPPTPVTKDSGSDVSRSNTASTAGISPIMSRVPSSATSALRNRQAGEGTTPAIAEEPVDTAKPAPQPASAAVPATSHQGPSKASQAHSRNVSNTSLPLSGLATPTRGESPARSPIVAMQKELPKAEAAQVASASSGTSHIMMGGLQGPSSAYSTREADIAAATMDASADNLPELGAAAKLSQDAFLESHQAQPPIEDAVSRSRSQSPSKNRVQALAGKFGEQSHSRRGSTQSNMSKHSVQSWEKSHDNSRAPSPTKGSPSKPSSPVKEFRPHLPGQWVSYATSAPTPSDVGDRDRQLGLDQEKPSAASVDLDLTPTRAKISNEASDLSDSNPLSALKSAGAAMAESFRTTVGLDTSSSEAREETTSHAARQPHGNIFVPRPLQLDRTVSALSSIPPTPPAKDTPKAELPPASAAESQAEKDNHDRNEPGFFPRQSTEIAAEDQESDRLREEIVASLSPVKGSAPLPTSKEQSTLHANGSTAERSSFVLPAEYDNYWGGGPTKSSEPQSTASEDFVPTLTVPAPISKHAEPVQPSLLTRFSWEQNTPHSELNESTATLDLPLEPAKSIEKAEMPVSVAEPTVVDAGQPKGSRDHAGAVHELDSGPSQTFTMSKSESTKEHGIANELPKDTMQALDTPISPTVTRSRSPGLHVVNSALDPEAVDLPPRLSADLIQKQSTSETEALQPPPPKNDTDLRLTMSSPSEVPASWPKSTKDASTMSPTIDKPLGGREIATLSSTAERITTYNKTRDHWAFYDHGLESWLSSALNANPALATQVLTPQRTSTGTIRHKHTASLPLLGKFSATSSGPPPPADPHTPAGVHTSPGNSPTAAGPYHSNAGFGGRIASQQMQAKGKDLLHSAGVLSGKGMTSAKGLFAKGKSRFQRDKDSSLSRSDSAPSPRGSSRNSGSEVTAMNLHSAPYHPQGVLPRVDLEGSGELKKIRRFSSPFHRTTRSRPRPNSVVFPLGTSLSAFSTPKNTPPRERTQFIDDGSRPNSFHAPVAWNVVPSTQSYEPTHHSPSNLQREIQSTPTDSTLQPPSRLGVLPSPAKSAFSQEREEDVSPVPPLPVEALNRIEQRGRPGVSHQMLQSVVRHSPSPAPRGNSGLWECPVVVREDEKRSVAPLPVDFEAPLYKRNVVDKTNEGTKSRLLSTTTNGTHRPRTSLIQADDEEDDQPPTLTYDTFSAGIITSAKDQLATNIVNSQYIDISDEEEPVRGNNGALLSAAKPSLTSGNVSPLLPPAQVSYHNGSKHSKPAGASRTELASSFDGEAEVEKSHNLIGLVSGRFGGGSASTLTMPGNARGSMASQHEAKEAAIPSTPTQRQIDRPFDHETELLGSDISPVSSTASSVEAWPTAPQPVKNTWRRSRTHDTEAYRRRRLASGSDTAARAGDRRSVSTQAESASVMSRTSQDVWSAHTYHHDHGQDPAATSAFSSETASRPGTQSKLPAFDFETEPTILGDLPAMSSYGPKKDRNQHTRSGLDNLPHHPESGDAALSAQKGALPEPRLAATGARTAEPPPTETRQAHEADPVDVEAASLVQGEGSGSPSARLAGGAPHLTPANGPGQPRRVSATPYQVVRAVEEYAASDASSLWDRESFAAHSRSNSSQVGDMRHDSELATPIAPGPHVAPPQQPLPPHGQADRAETATRNIVPQAMAPNGYFHVPASSTTAPLQHHHAAAPSDNMMTVPARSKSILSEISAMVPISPASSNAGRSTPSTIHRMQHDSSMRSSHAPARIPEETAAGQSDLTPRPQSDDFDLYADHNGVVKDIHSPVSKAQPSQHTQSPIPSHRGMSAKAESENDGRRYSFERPMSFISGPPDQDGKPQDQINQYAVPPLPSTRPIIHQEQRPRPPVPAAKDFSAGTPEPRPQQPIAPVPQPTLPHANPASPSPAAPNDIRAVSSPNPVQAPPQAQGTTQSEITHTGVQSPYRYGPGSPMAVNNSAQTQGPPRANTDRSVSTQSVPQSGLQSGPPSNAIAQNQGPPSGQDSQAAGQPSVPNTVPRNEYELQQQIAQLKANFQRFHANQPQGPNGVPSLQHMPPQQQKLKQQEKPKPRFSSVFSKFGKSLGGSQQQPAPQPGPPPGFLPGPQPLAPPAGQQMRTPSPNTNPQGNMQMQGPRPNAPTMQGASSQPPVLHTQLHLQQQTVAAPGTTPAGYQTSPPHSNTTMQLHSQARPQRENAPPGQYPHLTSEHHTKPSSASVTSQPQMQATPSSGDATPVQHAQPIALSQQSNVPTPPQEPPAPPKTPPAQVQPAASNIQIPMNATSQTQIPPSGPVSPQHVSSKANVAQAASQGSAPNPAAPRVNNNNVPSTATSTDHHRAASYVSAVSSLSQDTIQGQPKDHLAPPGPAQRPPSNGADSRHSFTSQGSTRVQPADSRLDLGKPLSPAPTQGVPLQQSHQGAQVPNGHPQHLRPATVGGPVPAKKNRLSAISSLFRVKDEKKAQKAQRNHTTPHTPTHPQQQWPPPQQQYRPQQPGAPYPPGQHPQQQWAAQQQQFRPQQTPAQYATPQYYAQQGQPIRAVGPQYGNAQTMTPIPPRGAQVAFQQGLPTIPQGQPQQFQPTTQGMPPQGYQIPGRGVPPQGLPPQGLQGAPPQNYQGVPSQAYSGVPPQGQPFVALPQGQPVVAPQGYQGALPQGALVAARGIPPQTLQYNVQQGQSMNVRGVPPQGYQTQYQQPQPPAQFQPQSAAVPPLQANGPGSDQSSAYLRTKQLAQEYEAKKAAQQTAPARNFFNQASALISGQPQQPQQQQRPEPQAASPQSAFPQGPRVTNPDPGTFGRPPLPHSQSIQSQTTTSQSSQVPRPGILPQSPEPQRQLHQDKPLPMPNVVQSSERSVTQPSQPNQSSSDPSSHNSTSIQQQHLPGQTVIEPGAYGVSQFTPSLPKGQPAQRAAAGPPLDNQTLSVERPIPLAATVTEQRGIPPQESTEPPQQRSEAETVLTQSSPQGVRPVRQDITQAGEANEDLPNAQRQVDSLQQFRQAQQDLQQYAQSTSQIPTQGGVAGPGPMPPSQDHAHHPSNAPAIAPEPQYAIPAIPAAYSHVSGVFVSPRDQDQRPLFASSQEPPTRPSAHDYSHQANDPRMSPVSPQVSVQSQPPPNHRSQSEANSVSVAPPANSPPANMDASAPSPTANRSQQPKFNNVAEVHQREQAWQMQYPEGASATDIVRARQREYMEETFKAQQQQHANRSGAPSPRTSPFNNHSPTQHVAPSQPSPNQSGGFKELLPRSSPQLHTASHPSQEEHSARRSPASDHTQIASLPSQAKQPAAYPLPHSPDSANRRSPVNPLAADMPPPASPPNTVEQQRVEPSTTHLSQNASVPVPEQMPQPEQSIPDEPPPSYDGPGIANDGMDKSRPDQHRPANIMTDADYEARGRGNAPRQRQQSIGILQHPQPASMAASPQRSSADMGAGDLRRQLVQQDEYDRMERIQRAQTQQIETERERREREADRERARELERSVSGGARVSSVRSATGSRNGGAPGWERRGSASRNQPQVFELPAVEDDEPQMRATSFPGQEWVPSYAWVED